MKKLLLIMVFTASFGFCYAQFNYNGTSYIYNNPFYNVGINTTTPAYPLTVNGLFQSSNFWAVTSNTYVGLGSQTGGGQNNTIFGYYNGTSITTGSANTIIGVTVGRSLTTGGDNVLIGSLDPSGSPVTALNLTTGSSNIFLGVGAGAGISTANNNVIIGTGAYGSNGANNTMVGTASGQFGTTGNHNTFFGNQTGQNNSSGSGNVFIGNTAGDLNTTGNNNTFIGNNANGTYGPPNLTNATAIGANAVVATSNSMVLGSGVNVGIGTGAPNQLLNINSSTAVATVSQFAINSNNSGSLSATNYSADANGFGFDVDYVAPNWVARNSTVGFLWKYTGVLSIMGSGGNAVGGVANPIHLMDVNLTNGNVGIGTTDHASGNSWTLATSPYKLSVGGQMIATAVYVKVISSWPDYVFKPSYHLPPLADVKTYIDENHHLPEMPSAEQIEKDGQNLGEMNKLLLKKVEELTLYLIENSKKNAELTVQLKSQQQQIDELNKQLQSVIDISAKQ